MNHGYLRPNTKNCNIALETPCFKCLICSASPLSLSNEIPGNLEGVAGSGPLQPFLKLELARVVLPCRGGLRFSGEWAFSC